LYWFIRNEPSPWARAGKADYADWAASREAQNQADAQYRQNQIDLQLKQLAQGGAGTALGWANLANTQSNQALQAQLNQAQLELQKAQFEYGKARDEKNFEQQKYWQQRQDYWTSRKDQLDRAQLEVQRGTALLQTGQRPESLIRYLYALRGEQAPQGGETNKLPGFGPGDLGAAAGQVPPAGPPLPGAGAPPPAGGGLLGPPQGPGMQGLLPSLQNNQPTGQRDDQGNPIMTTGKGEKISAGGGATLLNPQQVELGQALLQGGAGRNTIMANLGQLGTSPIGGKYGGRGSNEDFDWQDVGTRELEPEAKAREARAAEGEKVKYMWKGGELTLKAPHALVDLFSNKVRAIAGEAGPERVKFGGRAIDYEGNVRDPTQAEMSAGGGQYVNPAPAPQPQPPAGIDTHDAIGGMPTEPSMGIGKPMPGPIAAPEPGISPFPGARGGPYQPAPPDISPPTQIQPWLGGGERVLPEPGIGGGGGPVAQPWFGGGGGFGRVGPVEMPIGGRRGWGGKGGFLGPPNMPPPEFDIGAPGETGGWGGGAPPFGASPSVTGRSGEGNLVQGTPGGGQPFAGPSAKLFNPADMSSQMEKLKAKGMGFPQLGRATGGTSLIPSAQRWNSLTPAEQGLYRGALTDVWGIAPGDLDSLMQRLGTRTQAGAGVGRYRSSY
jgi:hypothetical protein